MQRVRLEPRIEREGRVHLRPPYALPGAEASPPLTRDTGERAYAFAMPNHAVSARANAVLLILLGTAGAAHAADLDGRGRSRAPLALQERTTSVFEAERYGAWGRPPLPHGRPVNSGPGYVGSDYGLGKPAFTGLGSRPDWGYSE